MADIFTDIYQQIDSDTMNAELKKKGYAPVYTASRDARIIIIGQAPGRKAQESMKPWDDASGVTLRKWLGVTEEQFYNPDLIALIPMDFYYPGKGAHGDLPPRKSFAKKYHHLLLAQMPRVKIIILIGAYSQKYYLGGLAKRTLTETVRAYKDYLPTYFPLVHSSPLNFRWRAKNPWFEADVVPELQRHIANILAH